MTLFTGRTDDPDMRDLCYPDAHSTIVGRYD
jgi:hypothetical protein